MLFSEPKITQLYARDKNVSSDFAVSVLFSEPKIPQLIAPLSALNPAFVSVLFSEPKIPQFAPVRGCGHTLYVFQCSSASRKFLNRMRIVVLLSLKEVSVLFSEPKIPQSRGRLNSVPDARDVSVLFSEPKIPQSRPSHLRPSIFPTAMITLRHS